MRFAQAGEIFQIRDFERSVAVFIVRRQQPAIDPRQRQRQQYP